MNILSIESSCDETAAAIISGDPKAKGAKPEILSNVVVSQIDIFKAYGGVIPEVASDVKPTDPYKLDIMPRSEIC